MKLKSNFFISLFFVFLLLITACNNGSPKYDDFAQCLASKDVKMYGTEWCPHCKAQKELFGKSFQYVDYTDCDKYKEECLVAGVEGYPTWVIDGKSYAGTQSLEKLAYYSGCELNPQTT